MDSTAGFKELIVKDHNLNLSFPVFVFYPADMPPAPVQAGLYQFNAAANAQAKPGRFPLVIISHGSGGSSLSFRTLALYLAKNGFIVIVPEHPFNNHKNNDWADTIENLTNRPRHITMSIEAVLLDGNLNIQRNNIAIIGHSMGAYTALAMAGGIPHTKHQIKYDPDCKIKISRKIPVTKDSRIKLIVALAPAAGWFLSEVALTNVQSPILIFSGGRDIITPVFHAEIIKNGVAVRNRVFSRTVKNAGHFSFLSPFPESMKIPGFLPAMDPPGFNRAQFHEKMNEDILKFLLTGKNPGAR